MSSIFNQIRLSFRRPDFWAYSSWLDIVTRYRRTRLGLFWLVAPILLFIFLIGGLYAQLFGRDLAFYFPHLAVGYAIWRLIVMVINDSINALRGNKAFILDGNVRITDFTLKSIAKALFYFGFAMLVVVAVLLWSPLIRWYHIPSLLITVPVVLVNLFWFSYVVSIIGARLPDFGEVVSTALMAGFLFTPIIWVGDRFAADTIGGWIVRANPAFHLLEVVRKPLYGMIPDTVSMIYVALMTLIGWLLAISICRLYSRFVPIWI